MPIKNKIQRGVTLIEAMIALLVISVGLLGIASLQITAMSQNTSALNHNKAVWIAYTMSDRIRANLPAFAAYDGIDTNNTYIGDCETAPCNNAAMVTADAADWQNMLTDLPGGRGIIRFNAANDGLLVDVMWDDEGSGATGTNCDPTDTNDLTCYTLAVAQPLAVGP
jgi:type IV pilus assembly protein PilV